MEDKVIYQDGDITYLLVQTNGEYVLREINKKTGTTKEKIITIAG